MEPEPQGPALALAPLGALADSDSASGLWVFGYGSLCWHPGFDFRRSVVGFIKGYARKFWQGNTTHRGTEGKPGRVATLVEEKDGVVWGRAFELSGDAALPYLTNRECKLGGYVTKFATFYPKRPCNDDAAAAGMPGQPFPALLYVATPSNRLWLGDAPLLQIAEQIVSCSGATGHNVEYLLRLAEYMRAAAPEADDDHLFCLEQLVRCEISQRRLCLDTLMGQVPSLPGAPCRVTAGVAEATVVDGDGLTQDDSSDSDDGDGEAAAAAAAVVDLPNPNNHHHHHRHHHHHHHHHPLEQPQQQPMPQAGAQQQEAFAFSSRVPSKKLRCLNI